MLLKEVFDPTFVDELASRLARQYPTFSAHSFRSAVFNDEWPMLELKARARHISLTLGKMLPNDFPRSVGMLMDVAPGLTGLPAMVFPDFVQVFGLDHVQHSMKALAHFTPLFSSEFAVRPFLERYGERIEQQMYRWAEDDNHHVRRLATEGMRPRLPWAPPLRKYIADPSPILPILERLKTDVSDYVRTSVANNVNDISKDHPDLVHHIIGRWREDPNVPETLLRKASRTMLRRGNTAFLNIFQEQPNAKVLCEGFEVLPRHVSVGEAAIFQTVITNTDSCPSNLRLEFAIGFVKSNGSVSRKVFAWRREELGANETRTFSRRFRFAHYTTRRQYLGLHSIDVIVNGETRATTAIEVV